MRNSEISSSLFQYVNNKHLKCNILKVIIYVCNKNEVFVNESNKIYARLL